MDLRDIERNGLDYILTDLLPLELPDLYTHKYFYNYLVNKKSELDHALKLIMRTKNQLDSNKTLFKSANWISMPLKYTIMKSDDSERELNVLQPMATLELFLFISSYQKEILNTLEKNSIYSIRFHKKNNNLYYKRHNKSLTQYFEDVSKNLDVEIIQQTGSYFKIGPFKSTYEFTNSEFWFSLYIKYKYFAKADYKSCFDSIYTHTYKWLIGKDVNDTKNFKNVNLFTTIDRVLQNINASTSNGIIVGPEFSRMIAEILLQGIDRTVMNKLLSLGYKHDIDYNIYRYVDDIFIFARSEDIIELILKSYSEGARKYLLSLNESKLRKEKLPFVLESWLKSTNEYVNQAKSIMFYTNEEIEIKKEKLKEKERLGEKTLNYQSYDIFKSQLFLRSKISLKHKFNELICSNEAKGKTIISYFFGMILNKIEQNKSKNNLIFSKNIKNNVIYDFLDFMFYVYSFYPDYNNTQRLLSIINYVNDEIDLKSDISIMQNLVAKYSFVFDKANINDIINLLMLCAYMKIEIPYTQECSLEDTLRMKDNPMLWACYLLYAQYDEQYFNDIKDEIDNLIINKMESILNKENALMYREFWWLIIFNRCHYISEYSQDKIDEIIRNIDKKGVTIQKSPDTICKEIFVDFLKNAPTQFFEWDVRNKNLLKEITYKTYQRSIFRNHKFKFNSMGDVSIS